MRRISLAVALIGALAATGCSGGAKPGASSGTKGTAGVNFEVKVKNQGPGTVTSAPAGISCAPNATCTATFASGTTVVLTATKDAGQYFNGWFGACSGTGTCSLSGDADKYVVSYFSASPDVHPNWADGATHSAKYADYLANAAGTLDCKACHGQSLQGQGLAPSCATCHPAPGGTIATKFVPGTVTVPAGGLAGVVYTHDGPVAGATVYAVPTMDVLADSIYTPAEYSDTATYAANALVEDAEGIYQNVSGGPLTGVAPPADLSVRNSVPEWQFVAVVHTPHAYSSRNSYKTGGLVIVANKVPSTTWAVSKAYQVGQEVVVGAAYPKNAYKVVVAGTSAATGTGPSGTGTGIVDGTITWDYVGSVASASVDVNGAAINTVFAVYEALKDLKGSVDTSNAPWSSISALTIDPPGAANVGSAAWEYVGDPRQLAFFDNLPAWAKKTYVAGSLVRDGGKVYRTAAGGVSTTTATKLSEDVALSWTQVGGTATLKSLAVAANVDEPLEGTIRAKNYGAAYQAVTDANGVYSFATLPASPFSGKFYFTVIPATAAHLPGGDQCRKPLASSAVANTQLNIKVATAPSAGATFVGQTACISCHGDKHNTSFTAHSLGISKLVVDNPAVNGGRPVPGTLQNYARFPNWFAPLAQFEVAGGTKLCATYGTSYKYVKRACDPVANANDKFEILLSNETLNGKKYYTLKLTNSKNPASPWTGANPDGTARTDGKYFIELGYGGGIHKQRYLTKIDASRYTLPLQFNDEGSTNETLPGGRLQWQDYTNGDWYNPTTNSAVVISAYRSFDSMCAGCHFTGYKLNVAANTAKGVVDGNGEYDYDGDGQLEQMNVSCESCHGPGSEHVLADGKSDGIVNPKLLTPEREVAICSQCHTRFVGNGGVLSGAALATEAPLKDVAGVSEMPRAGISRKEFLQNHVSKIDDGMWDAAKGNGKYPVKHHQQASDFLTTAKYRNQGIPLGGYSVTANQGLMTCSSCHDLHGDSGVARQLTAPLDVGNAASTSTGLCRGCHNKTLGGTGHTDRGSAAPYSAGTGNHTLVASWTCASCHVPRTAKSGSGAVANTVGGETFYRGDISSHLFIGVPYVYYSAPAKLPTSAKTATASDIMPIPMTDSCAASCHTAPRSAWKDGIQ